MDGNSLQFHKCIYCYVGLNKLHLFWVRSFTYLVRLVATAVTEHQVVFQCKFGFEAPKQFKWNTSITCAIWRMFVSSTSQNWDFAVNLGFNQQLIFRSTTICFLDSSNAMMMGNTGNLPHSMVLYTTSILTCLVFDWSQSCLFIPGLQSIAPFTAYLLYWGSHDIMLCKIMSFYRRVCNSCKREKSVRDGSFFQEFSRVCVWYTLYVLKNAQLHAWIFKLQPCYNYPLHIG